MVRATVNFHGVTPDDVDIDSHQGAVWIDIGPYAIFAKGDGVEALRAIGAAIVAAADAHLAEIEGAA